MKKNITTIKTLIVVLSMIGFSNLGNADARTCKQAMSSSEGYCTSFCSALSNNCTSNCRTAFQKSVDNFQACTSACASSNKGCSDMCSRVYTEVNNHCSN